LASSLGKIADVVGVDFQKSMDSKALENSIRAGAGLPVDT
jgi:hypothetical protein